jgi:methylated-DNA-[protein]-cysteine S-methyltransferase
MTARLKYCLRKTPFGPVAVVWSDHRGRPGILRVMLSRPGVSAGRLVRTFFPDAILSACAVIQEAAGRMAAFLAGEDIRFSLDIARMDLCSGFQRKVLRAEHGIPRGYVSTYGRIAGRIGCAGGARAVGSALAGNPFPIIIPCHRAVRSDGSPGGYQGGTAMKRALLEMEGIGFDGRGRVVTQNIFY